MSQEFEDASDDEAMRAFHEMEPQYSQLYRDLAAESASKQNSEVARLLAQINSEYEAAQQGLSGLASGVGQHRFITKRMEQIAELHSRLRDIVGDEAMGLIARELEDLTDKKRFEDREAREKGLQMAARIEHLCQGDEGFQRWIQEGIDDIEARRTVMIELDDDRQEELDPDLLASIAERLHATAYMPSIQRSRSELLREFREEQPVSHYDDTA